ncbi:MAG: DUF2189 domain-containing protein [Rhodocyclaceae bacterium]|nr:DUF2189 domain-containing protein [Rhodocyclaceae bacterium]
MSGPAPVPRRIAIADLVGILGEGWQVFRACRAISLAVGAAVTLAGLVLAVLAVTQGLAPMVPALAGGFLLLGPVAMAGLAGVALQHWRGRTPGMGSVLAELRAAPRGLWALVLFCILIDFIWLTDAGTLYSFLIGERRATLGHVLPTDAASARYHLFSTAMGFVLANVVFAVSAHAVPLLVRGERSLVRAVMASVRAVATSPLAHGAWAALLAATIFMSLLVPPLLCVALPVLAYAGTALDRHVFPDRLPS